MEISEGSRARVHFNRSFEDLMDIYVTGRSVVYELDDGSNRQHFLQFKTVHMAMYNGTITMGGQTEVLYAKWYFSADYSDKGDGWGNVQFSENPFVYGMDSEIIKSIINKARIFEITP